MTTLVSGSNVEVFTGARRRRSRQCHKKSSSFLIVNIDFHG
jgi:hypothetical protein